MNAIQKFAAEHGTDDSDSLEQAFKSAVQSVIGNKGKVIDAWNDGGSIGYCDWHCSVKGVDGMAPNTEFMLTLTTNEQNGRSWLACQYDNDDCDILGDAEGTVGEFDPLPLFNKCLESASESCKAESKKSEAKKHVCSMQKKKESLAKKNESEVSLPKDVEDAMKKVRAYLRGNYASIVDSGLVSDADCSVGYQLDNALNVLDDIVANFPKG